MNIIQRNFGIWTSRAFLISAVQFVRNFLQLINKEIIRQEWTSWAFKRRLTRLKTPSASKSRADAWRFVDVIRKFSIFSTKEKIAKFDQIQSSLSALQNNSNFKTYLSNAVQILLLFCEDNDSNCRISAEENLSRIIRNSERSNQIVLVQIDLYHEMKKNGNERWVTEIIIRADSLGFASF